MIEFGLMQTFIVVSVSAVTVREGDGAAAVRCIANNNAAQSLPLPAQNNGGERI